MRINVPDDVVEAYSHYAERTHRPVDLVMAEQLARCAHMRPDDRFVTLNGAILGQVEEIVQGGQVLSPKDLVQKIQRLAAIKVGDINLPFTPAELEELLEMAIKREMPFEELVKQTVQRMREEFFHYASRVPATPGV